MDIFIQLWHLWHDEFIELMRLFDGEFEELYEFMIVYPFALSLLWATHGVLYLIKQYYKYNPTLDDNTLPTFSVIIPFYAEYKAALQTARSLNDITPPPLEIIMIDDASPEPALETHSDPLPARSQVIRLTRRGGKAGALNKALNRVTADIVVCMDADSMATEKDWRNMLRHFSEENTAAVTGKIQPAKCRSILERFQHLDYLAVICLIKAAESTWGGLMTVSGAFVAYRRSVLIALGGWNEQTATEDIDLSWRLQSAGWRIVYECQWSAQVQMAPNFMALWRQRRRWGMGLGRAARDHFFSSFTNPHATQVAVAIVLMFNWLWILLTLIFVGVWLVHGSINWMTSASIQWISNDLYRYWLLAWLVFLLQYSIAALLYRPSRFDYFSLILLTPFYPLYFWAVLFSSFISGFPMGFTHHDSGVWQRTMRRQDQSRDGTDKRR